MRGESGRKRRSGTRITRESCWKCYAILRKTTNVARGLKKKETCGRGVPQFSKEI